MLGVDAAPVVGSEVDDIFWSVCVASAVCDSVCVCVCVCYQMASKVKSDEAKNIVAV